MCRSLVVSRSDGSFGHHGTCMTASATCTTGPIRAESGNWSTVTLDSEPPPTLEPAHMAPKCGRTPPLARWTRRFGTCLRHLPHLESGPRPSCASGAALWQGLPRIADLVHLPRGTLGGSADRGRRLSIRRLRGMFLRFRRHRTSGTETQHRSLRGRSAD